MKIGIVNDTPMMVEVLRRVIAESGRHELIWIARDGEQAVQMCAWQLPDVVLMDLLMPKVDGAEATRRIMEATPCPILVVTSDMDTSADKIYEAMGYGALDATQTPALIERMVPGVVCHTPVRNLPAAVCSTSQLGKRGSPASRNTSRCGASTTAA